MNVIRNQAPGKQSAFLVAAIGVIVIGLAGCGKSDDKGGGPQPITPPQPPVSYRAIQTAIFDVSCKGCHNPTKTKGGVDLSSYALVMDTTPSIVKAGDPEGSRLYKAIAHLDKDNVTPMPLGAPGTTPKKIADDQIKAVYDWIKAGAKDN